MLQSLFYLTTALHVLGITITHLQEHKTTVTTASGNRYTILLSAAIVEELELFHGHIAIAQPLQRPATKNVCKTRGCNYSF
jgi:hypothetical protein